MMEHEQLLIRLSAYADGELAGEEAREVAAALEADPELRRVLARFRRLDDEAAVLPVPQMDRDAGAALWELVAERTLRAARGQAAAADSQGAWKDLAAALPEPPEIGADRWSAVWAGVRERIELREEALTPAPSAAESAPLEADFTPVDMAAVPALRGAPPAPRARRSILVWPVTFLTAAAAVLLVVWTGFLGPRPPAERNGGQVAKDEFTETPRANDQHYFMLVRHVPGVDAEVVCFFEKEDDSE